MLKNLTGLELKVEDKVYKFICEVDAPIGVIHDALTEMKNFVVQRINEANKQQQPVEKSTDQPEVVVEGE